MQTLNIFPKTHRFFTISFSQADDVYVKIYETAQLCFMFFANVLWVAFSIPSVSLSLVKYHVYKATDEKGTKNKE
jgi:hypothetical protein